MPWLAVFSLTSRPGPLSGLFPGIAVAALSQKRLKGLDRELRPLHALQKRVRMAAVGGKATATPARSAGAPRSSSPSQNKQLSGGSRSPAQHAASR